MTCSQFSWCRLWCVLRHATIKCWDCKEDSNHRDPVECIEIKPVRCGIATYTYFSKRFCTSHQWLYLSSPRLILVDVGYRIPSGVLRQDISLLLIFRLAHRNKSKLCILLGSQNANQETEPIFMIWSGRNCLILQKRETRQEASACKLFFADRAFSHNQLPRLKPSIQRTFQRLQIF